MLTQLICVFDPGTGSNANASAITIPDRRPLTFTIRWNIGAGGSGRYLCPLTALFIYLFFKKAHFSNRRDNS